MTSTEGPAVLGLDGELDDPDAVRAAIEDASEHYSRSLRVDLSAVTYLPSVVIGVLFGAMKQAEAAGTEVEVAVAPGTVVHSILLVTAMPHVTV